MQQLSHGMSCCASLQQQQLQECLLPAVVVQGVMMHPVRARQKASAVGYVRITVHLYTVPDAPPALNVSAFLHALGLLVG